MRGSERTLRAIADWFYIALADEKDREKAHAEWNKGNYGNEAAIEVYTGKARDGGCGIMAVLLLIGGTIPFFFL
jgi:hypothetical protein